KDLQTNGGEVLAGMCEWLSVLNRQGVQTPVGKIQSATTVTFGDHPTYGQGVALTAEGGGRIAIGLLLGTGGGMWKDLTAKLRMMDSRDAVGEPLILLWPREIPAGTPADTQLRGETRKTWLAFKHVTKRVRLRSLPDKAWHAWLALASWEQNDEGQQAAAQ